MLASLSSERSSGARLLICSPLTATWPQRSTPRISGPSVRPESAIHAEHASTGHRLASAGALEVVPACPRSPFVRGRKQVLPLPRGDFYISDLHPGVRADRLRALPDAPVAAHRRRHPAFRERRFHGPPHAPAIPVLGGRARTARAASLHGGATCGRENGSAVARDAHPNARFC